MRRHVITVGNRVDVVTQADAVLETARRRRSLGSALLNASRAGEMQRRGCVVWLTGLPGAGKTTLAEALRHLCEADGLIVDVLDGDVIRRRIGTDLGYSKADRVVNIERLSWIASRIARAGAVVIVAAISPYLEGRRRAREEIELESWFCEVHVSTPLSECARRDPKGLYQRAFGGALGEFTGVSAPYEPPLEPEIRLDTTSLSVAAAAEILYAGLTVCLAATQPDARASSEPAGCAAPSIGSRGSQ